MILTKSKKDRSRRQPGTVCNRSSKGKPLTIRGNSIVSDFPFHFNRKGNIYGNNQKARQFLLDPLL